MCLLLSEFAFKSNSASLGSFCPSIAIAVQRCAGDAKLAAALGKLRRTVANMDPVQIWKRYSFRRQVFEYV